MEDDILIDNYLKGLLSKDEQQLFLERLESDIEFSEKFKLEEQLFNSLSEDNWSHLKSTSDEVDEYKKLLEEDDLEELSKTLSKTNDEFNSKSSSRSRKLFYYLAAASVVIFLGFQIFFNQGASNQDLYAEYIALKDLPSFVSRDTEESMLVKAQDLFENEKYEEALTIFQSQVSTTDNRSNVLVYQGIAQVELGKYNEAEKTFDVLINSNLLDAQKGYWYKALLLLKQGRIEDTKNALNKIIEGNLYNKSKAIELLEELG